MGRGVDRSLVCDTRTNDVVDIRTNPIGDEPVSLLCWLQRQVTFLRGEFMSKEETKREGRGIPREVSIPMSFLIGIAISFERTAPIILNLPPSIPYYNLWKTLLITAFMFSLLISLLASISQLIVFLNINKKIRRLLRRGIRKVKGWWD